MRIAILVEGRTEKAFKPYLLAFLNARLSGNMPKLDFVPFDGGLPTKDKLQRVVQRLLGDKKNPADAVIALTDVYPGFKSADDAKTKLTQWAGKEDRFYVHVALHDFEAWLLPYWGKIQKLTGSDRKSPGDDPEQVNLNNPPAFRIADVYRTGPKSKAYVKPRDAGRILRNENLTVAVNACSELKAFVNRILALCGTEDAELIS